MSQEVDKNDSAFMPNQYEIRKLNFNINTFDTGIREKKNDENHQK